MEPLLSLNPESYEGTWEEITELAPKFAGHRVRLEILPIPEKSQFADTQISDESIWVKNGKSPIDSTAMSLQEQMKVKPVGLYSAYIQEAIAKLSPATPEELRIADEENAEFMHRLNENRRQAGARLLFPDA